MATADGDDRADSRYSTRDRAARIGWSWPIKTPATAGKSGAGTDVVDAHFVELTPDVRVVQTVVFDSPDPAFAGTMTMTWELHKVDGGTEVVFRADDVPDGISAEDHAAGMNASLDNLTRFLTLA